MKTFLIWLGLCMALVYGGYRIDALIGLSALFLLWTFFKFFWSCIKEDMKDLSEWRTNRHQDRERERELTIRLLNRLREADNK